MVLSVAGSSLVGVCFLGRVVGWRVRLRGGWVGDGSVPVNFFGRSPFAQVFGYDFVEYFLSEIFRSFMEASR